MKNIDMTVSKDGVLNIAVDLKQTFGTSKSGKSEIIGTTEGNIAAPAPYDDVRVGLNVYRGKQDDTK